jgi:hypothetical protein
MQVYVMDGTLFYFTQAWGYKVEISALRKM